MVHSPRKKLFVDRAVQGALLTRVAVYWALCLTAATAMMLVWRILTGPARLFYTHFDEMWFYYAPAVVVLTLLLPFLLFDTVRVSNRFVGPILRMRRTVREAAAGRHVAPIHFRKDDYWQEFADEFNQLIAELQQLRQQREGATTSEPATTRGPKA